MTWQQYQPMDDIKVVPKDVDKSYKTYWDSDSRCWKNTWMYRVQRRMEAEYWLKENYKDQYNTGPTGWNITFDRLVMGEKIYLHYCLAKPE